MFSVDTLMKNSLISTTLHPSSSIMVLVWHYCENPFYFKSLVATPSIQPLGLGDKHYHIEFAFKFMLITMISSGHFYSIWINLTACHTAEIKATEASQCMLLISLYVLCASVWMNGAVSSDTHVTPTDFNVFVSMYEDLNTLTSTPELLRDSLHQLYTHTKTTIK